MEKTFSDLGLDEKLLQAINDLGFVTPTPIQQQAIPVLLQSTTDLVGLAQTGTGKTAAFGLPLLHHVDSKDNTLQGIILCPTRELCMQISRDLLELAKYKSGLEILAVYGGTDIVKQIRSLKKGVQIVVATPGRLMDLMERKAINLTSIKHIVLDEADEMLNMGFREDIDFILADTPNKQSTWLFSATMPSEVRNIAKKFMTNPAEVTVGKKNTGAANIDHQYCVVALSQKYEALKRLIDFNPDMYGIIFTRTKAEAKEITDKLSREKYEIEALHGDMEQGDRDMVMGRFRSKTLQLLIATDVAARGIDVDGVTHVINFGLPDEVEVYTHRSGRTARAGKSGICISIIVQKDAHKCAQTEKLVSTKFHRIELPSGHDVCRKQFFHFIDKVLKAPVEDKEYDTYLPVLKEQFANMEKEEIIKRFSALEFNRFLHYYRNASDLNQKPGRENEFVSGGKYQQIYVNLGTKDGLYKASLLEFVLDTTGLSKNVLGNVDLRDIKTYFEVEPASVEQFVSSLNGHLFKGRKIFAETTRARSGSRGHDGKRMRTGGGGGERGGERSSFRRDDSPRGERTPFRRNDESRGASSERPPFRKPSERSGNDKPPFRRNPDEKRPRKSSGDKGKSSDRW